MEVTPEFNDDSNNGRRFSRAQYAAGTVHGNFHAFAHFILPLSYEVGAIINFVKKKISSSF